MFNAYLVERHLSMHSVYCLARTGNLFFCLVLGSLLLKISQNRYLDWSCGN